MTSYTIRSTWQPDADAQIRTLTVHLEYKDARTPFYSSAWITFDAPDQSYRWTVTPPDAAVGQAFYSGVIRYVDGQAAPIPLTAIDGTTVLVGEVAPQRTVTLLADALDWRQISRAEVRLTAGAAQTLITFDGGSAGPHAWSFTPPPGLAGYRWQACYRLPDGTALELPAAVATAPLLQLPALPPPYQVAVGVTTEDFDALGIASIEVTLIGGLGLATSHTFTAADRAPWQAMLREHPDPQAERARVFDYRYTVRFAGESPPYQSPLITGVQSSTITIREVGLIRFDATAVDFELVPSIEVQYQVAGATNRFTLQADDRVHVLRAGSDYPPLEPLRYRLDYTIGAQGHYLQADLPLTAAAVALWTPVAPKTVQIVGVGLSGSAPSIKSVMLSNLEYREAGAGWQLAGTLPSVKLDATTTLATCTFPAVDPLRAALRYEGVIVRSSNEQRRIQPTYVTQSVVAVGDLPAWFAVRIDPSAVDWQRFRAVELWLSTSGGAPNPARLRFTAGMGLDYWGYFLATGDETYCWRATYVPWTGSPRVISEQSSSGMLLLPSTPPKG